MAIDHHGTDEVEKKSDDIDVVGDDIVQDEDDDEDSDPTNSTWDSRRRSDGHASHGRRRRRRISDEVSKRASTPSTDDDDKDTDDTEDENGDDYDYGRSDGRRHENGQVGSRSIIRDAGFGPGAIDRYRCASPRCHRTANQDCANHRCKTHCCNYQLHKPIGAAACTTRGHFHLAAKPEETKVYGALCTKEGCKKKANQACTNRCCMSHCHEQGIENGSACTLSKHQEYNQRHHLSPDDGGVSNDAKGETKKSR